MCFGFIFLNHASQKTYHRAGNHVDSTIKRYNQCCKPVNMPVKPSGSRKKHKDSKLAERQCNSKELIHEHNTSCF